MAEGGLGLLDANAIEKVCAEAWPQATSADELHETLLLVGALTDDEVRTVGSDPFEWLQELLSDKRAGRLQDPPRGTRLVCEADRSEPLGRPFWIAAERVPMLKAVYPDRAVEPALVPPQSESERQWQRADAVRELVRGRLEVAGPTTATKLASLFQLPVNEIDTALIALEGEGFVLRGKFHPGSASLEWCDRRLLARIHRFTLNRLRAEIQPVSIAEFQRFLLAWQRVEIENRADGIDGVRAVLELLDGYELPAAAWEPEVLVLRVKEYRPAWLDQLCFTGRFGWGRLTPPQRTSGRPRCLCVPARFLCSRVRTLFIGWRFRLLRRDRIFSGYRAGPGSFGSGRCAIFWRARPADRSISVPFRKGFGRTRRSGMGYGRQF